MDEDKIKLTKKTMHHIEGQLKALGATDIRFRMETCHSFHYLDGPSGMAPTVIAKFRLAKDVSVFVRAYLTTEGKLRKRQSDRCVYGHTQLTPAAFMFMEAHGLYDYE